MLIVCVHYPLDPQMSKKCISRVEHWSEEVTELTIPFTGSYQAFLTAVERMYVLGNITGSEMQMLKSGERPTRIAIPVPGTGDSN